MKVIVISTIAILLFQGCATQTAATLKENPSKSEAWQINLPIYKVYRDYKDYAEKNHSGSNFLGSGLRVRGEFYAINEGAELTIKLEGNPLGQITYLHLEFEKIAEGTRVIGWYYNSHWKSAMEKFKSIHPTHSISGGTN